MVEHSKSIWIDGEFTNWDDACVHLFTHSLHYGVAAFEGIRSYHWDNSTRIFRLEDHVDRLFESCKMAFLRPTFSREQIIRACVDSMRESGLAEGYLRPMVFVGEGAMGTYAPDNPVRTAILVWKWGTYQTGDALQNGLRCKISSFARHHVNTGLTRAKITGQYTNSVLAKREAKLCGCDGAIMLDTNGYVSEGSGENIFVVKRGTLLTPDLSSSVLAGITRDTIIQLAREENLEVIEGRLTRDQLWLADEVFFTGTVAEVTPVREIDHRIIGDGTVGPITKQLQVRFFDVVRGLAHPEWSTKV